MTKQKDRNIEPTPDIIALQRAITIAVTAHEGQLDKAGMPYIGHLVRVMNAGTTPTQQIGGILHDLIEDTDWTAEALLKEGFTNEVVDAIICLTKRPEEESYDEYLGRIKHNKLAVKIKIADLIDNLDVTRLNYITEPDTIRLQKYLKAYKELTAI